MKMSPSKKGLLPIVASFLTSVLAFLAHRPHRPFFDFGKNRNRPTVKFQNFGNRNARFCRLGAKSMAGTGSNRRHGGWGDHLYSAAGRRERFPRPAEGCSCALWAGRTVRKTMVSTPQHNSQFANDYRSESSITVRKLIILLTVPVARSRQCFQVPARPSASRPRSPCGRQAKR
jgi:hypothetical protein